MIPVLTRVSPRVEKSVRYDDLRVSWLLELSSKKFAHWDDNGCTIIDKTRKEDLNNVAII